MFEIIEKEDSVNIKYSYLHKKHYLMGAIIFCGLLLFGSIFMLFLYFFEGITIGISIIGAAAFFCAVIILYIRYKELCKFNFIIDGSGIKFYTKKEKYEAVWKEIKSYGIIKGAGSESIDYTIAGSFYERPSDSLTGIEPVCLGAINP